MPSVAHSRAARTILAITMLAMIAEGFAAGGDTGEKYLARLRKRAEQGFVQQQVELAAAYLTGKGVTRDAAQAAHWYLKAAESSDPGAENEVGYLYEAGIGVPRSQERAFHWFQLSASSGLLLGKVNLGVSYYRGLGVRADPMMARQLFREAADKGSGSGANYLGVMDQLGLGVPVDRASAAHWFEMGVKFHDPESAYNLACLYANAEDRPRDLRRAAELLRISAGKGYVPAKHFLGLLIVNHPEIAEPDEQARSFLVEASNAGSWKSSILLGILARDGRGVNPDPGQAWYYFNLARLQGGPASEELASRNLKALESKLSTEERSALTARAESWFQQQQAEPTFVFDEADSGRNYPLLARAIPE